MNKVKMPRVVVRWRWRIFHHEFVSLIGFARMSEDPSVDFYAYIKDDETTEWFISSHINLIHRVIFSDRIYPARKFSTFIFPRTCEQRIARKTSLWVFTKKKTHSVSMARRICRISNIFSIKFVAVEFLRSIKKETVWNLEISVNSREMLNSIFQFDVSCFSFACLPAKKEEEEKLYRIWMFSSKISNWWDNSTKLNSIFRYLDQQKICELGKFCSTSIGENIAKGGW